MGLYERERIGATADYFSVVWLLLCEDRLATSFLSDGGHVQIHELRGPKLDYGQHIFY